MIRTSGNEPQRHAGAPAQMPQQTDDLVLHHDVERGHRLFDDQKFRFANRPRRDQSPTMPTHSPGVTEKLISRVAGNRDNDASHFPSESSTAKKALGGLLPSAGKTLAIKVRRRHRVSATVLDSRSVAGDHDHRRLATRPRALP
jgi:hypothetical protein